MPVENRPSNVLEIPRPALADVPRMLRELAARIEMGDLGQVDGVVAVIAQGRHVLVHPMGAGLDDCRTLAALTRAQTRLAFSMDDLP